MAEIHTNKVYLNMSDTLKHFIDGDFFQGKSTQTGEVFNPATGKVHASLRYANAEDTEVAILSAQKALPSWAATPPLKRARILFKFKELLDQNHKKLAQLITLEHGKVLSDAMGEVTRGIEVVEFACGIPHLIKGEFSENVGTNVDCHSTRQAVGVCVGITPFNFPAMVPMWMFPMAIACGNTFILKPSEKDPSTANFIAELLTEASLPDGVFNVLHGDKAVVDILLSDPRIAAVSFVGSTPIARSIYETCAKHGKRVQALGGAKNHMVVMPDADMDQAVDALMGAAYGSAGERCMAISVAVAVDPIGDELVKRLEDKVRILEIGPGILENSEMGPLVTKEHLNRVLSYIDTGIDEGAKLIVDGRHFEHHVEKGGYYMGGCLFDHVTADMKIYQEEIFGPVLVVVRVPDFDSAVCLINEHEFGNGTAIFTRDGDAARSFTSQIQVGMVGVNVPIPVPMAFHSFGGWKNSLFGDTAMHGMEGVRFYTRLKTVTSRWPTGIRAGAQFTMPVME